MKKELYECKKDPNDNRCYVCHLFAERMQQRL